MLNDLSVTVRLKQKLWFKLLFKLVMFLHTIRILKDEHVLNIVNYALSVGAFKTKTDNGKWTNLKIDKKFEFAD